MHKSNHHAIRMSLHKYTDGLTVTEIAERIEKPRNAVHRSLAEMPDAYVDRWTSCRKQWAAVWCVVVPPENCPKPKDTHDRARTKPT
jgi:hypothetical protein